MKIPKKLTAFLTAFLMSVYALPSAVWGGSMPAAETTPTETTVETTAETTVETTAETTVETTSETTEETTVETTEETTAETTETTEEDDFSVEPFSLLPLDTTSATVTLDRRSSIPSGLADKPMYSLYVYEALQKVLEQKRVIPKGGSYTGAIRYATYYDDSYKSVGWNDIISLDESYVSYDSTERIYFILGDDQLDMNNKKFDIEVNFMCFDRNFIEQMGVSIYNKAGKVDIIREDAYLYHESDGTIGVQAQYTMLGKNFEEDEKPGVHIDLPDGYSSSNVRIYSGSTNITSRILGSTPYSANQYSNDLTFVFTRGDGSKATLPVNLLINLLINRVEYDFIDENVYTTSFYSSPDTNDYHNYLGSGVIYSAGSFDNINTGIYAHYYDYLSDYGNWGFGKAYIDFACIGKYSSKEEALNAGASDIKDQLFSSNGVSIPLSPDTERTAYTYSGDEATIRTADITVIDTYGVVYNETKCWGISGEFDTPIYSYGTYFNIYGANKANGDSLRSYEVSRDDDSYYQNGYQTVFLLDSTSPVTPVTNGTAIYPEFYADDDAKIFMNGSPVISETSPVNFNSGTALQYSASSQSGTHLKNYWVTFVTQQTGGAELFVNATNYTGHYSKSGKPQREIFLNSNYDYHHDIFFANIGDAQLQGINVSLSPDVQGVKLDEYWNVIGGSVRTLNPFTETYDPDNIAKVRLVPVSDDYFGPISGTLTISTSNGGSQDIELTGIAGVPKITTDKLYDGVKYVPYSSVIMTNNMYDADAMKFSITSGRLPKGVSLKPNGELYGMPTEVGEFTFTVKAAYVGGTGTFGAEDISSSRTYTITITDNTDENVDAVNTDEQGYELLDRVTKDITVYYSSGTPGSTEDPPTVTEIVYSSKLFRSEGAYDEFLNFYIDGIELEHDGDYSAEEGSTKITVRDQTFNNIALTGEDVPHTLAAEFRTEGGTKDLKRSAQNVYFKYVYRPAGNIPGSNPGGNPGSDPGSTPSGGGSTGGGSSNNGSAVVPTNVSFDTVTAIMTIVDENNEPIPNLSLELRSTPKRATTDDSGNVKFNSVDFGRHTLYVKDSSGKNKTSASFTLVSGLETKVDGNIITARVDGTVRINVLYDGSKLEFRAAETEDVSAAAGASLTDDMIYASISKADFEVIIMVLILLTASAVSTFAVIRKNKGKNKQ